jgi:hypothetical protein
MARVLDVRDALEGTRGESVEGTVIEHLDNPALHIDFGWGNRYVSAQ